jgi:hypothetical protein
VQSSSVTPPLARSDRDNLELVRLELVNENRRGGAQQTGLSFGVGSSSIFRISTPAVPLSAQGDL